MQVIPPPGSACNFRLTSLRVFDAKPDDVHGVNNAIQGYYVSYNGISKSCGA